MRIDKFLKVSRLVKRRTVAQETCEAGRVKINGKTAKPGNDVRVGDELVIAFGAKRVAVTVLSVDEKTKPGDAPAMYRQTAEESDPDQSGPEA